MYLSKVHLSAGLALLLSIGYTSSVVYQASKKTTFNDENSIILSHDEKPSEYIRFRHLDGNLDGVITKLEVENVDKYRAPMEAYDFTKKLTTLDKRLVYGLSFVVAKQAVTQLSDSEKHALLKVNLPERVNLINSRFA